MSHNFTSVIVLYFTFIFDLVTTFCFLFFHDNKNTTLNLLFGDHAQLVSEYPTI